jgi:hypothetical protein
VTEPHPSPGELHHLRTLQQQRQEQFAAADARRWDSLTPQEQAAELAQRRVEEQRRLAAEKARAVETQQREAEAIREDEVQAASAAAARQRIVKTIEILVAADVPTLSIRQDDPDKPLLFARRLGRGWIVGNFSIYFEGSGPSGRSAGQPSVTNDFLMFVTTTNVWVLVRSPPRPYRAYRKGRLYGNRFEIGRGRSSHERRVDKTFQERLPDYADRLQAIATEHDLSA